MAALVRYAIATALQTAVRLCNGTGDYHFDLSSASRVVIGRPDATAPVRQLMVHLYPVSLTGDTARTLSNFAPTFTFALEVFAPAANGSPAGRVEALCQAMADLDRALAADRGLGGLVHDVSPVVWTDLRDDPDELRPLPWALGEVSVTWEEVRS